LRIQENCLFVNPQSAKVIENKWLRSAENPELLARSEAIYAEVIENKADFHCGLSYQAKGHRPQQGKTAPSFPLSTAERGAQNEADSVFLCM
jgi:hypothetical protein